MAERGENISGESDAKLAVLAKDRARYLRQIALGESGGAPEEFVFLLRRELAQTTNRTDDAVRTNGWKVVDSLEGLAQIFPRR